VNSEREEHKKVKKPYCASLTKRPRSALHPAYTVRLLRAEGKDSIPLSTGRRTPASPALPSAISKLPPILAKASCSLRRFLHTPAVPKRSLSCPQAVRMTTFAVTAIFLRFATPLPIYLYQTIKVN